MVERDRTRYRLHELSVHAYCRINEFTDLRKLREQPWRMPIAPCGLPDLRHQLHIEAEGVVTHSFDVARVVPQVTGRIEAIPEIQVRHIGTSCNLVILQPFQL